MSDRYATFIDDAWSAILARMPDLPDPATRPSSLALRIIAEEIGAALDAGDVDGVVAALDRGRALVAALEAAPVPEHPTD